ncbi:MAG: SURF1 family protein [Rubrivivax sp.]
MGRARRLVVLLAALALAALTARLGVWQLDRAAQKQALQAAVDSRRDAPELPAAELARTPEAASAQHNRRTVLQGQWRDAHTVWLDNRQMQGRPGFFVVTPLVLADGSAVLVQRGWQPRDAADRTRVVRPPTPAGTVRVSGRIAPPPARLYEFEAAGEGPIRQNLDVPAFARETGLALRPLSLMQLDEPGAPADGLLRDWPAPAAGVHKHHGYAFQWFALSALSIVLYVWFQLIRPRRRLARTNP